MIYFIIVTGIASLFIIRFLERLSKIERALGGTSEPINKELEKKWSDLSWSGKNPWQVIRLGSEMAARMDNKFMGQKHLTSCFYSQVKYLVRKGQFPSAIAFLLEARSWAKTALDNRNTVPQESRNPIDLEVLGAPDFMLACVPIIGIFLFKEHALSFLEIAEREAINALSDNALDTCIIWSKLWRLTKENSYRLQIRAAGLRRDMDEGQLLRIAKHLGLKNLQELYSFCNI